MNEDHLFNTPQPQPIPYAEYGSPNSPGFHPHSPVGQFASSPILVPSVPSNSYPESPTKPGISLYQNEPNYPSSLSNVSNSSNPSASNNTGFSGAFNPPPLVANFTALSNNSNSNLSDLGSYNSRNYQNNYQANQANQANQVNQLNQNYNNYNQTAVNQNMQNMQNYQNIQYMQNINQNANQNINVKMNPNIQNMNMNMNNSVLDQNNENININQKNQNIHLVGTNQNNNQNIQVMSLNQNNQNTNLNPIMYQNQGNKNGDYQEGLNQNPVLGSSANLVLNMPANNSSSTVNNSNNYNNNNNTSSNISTNISKTEKNDYVYFERRPDMFSKETQEKAAGIKIKLENFYDNSINHAIDRNQRKVNLEYALLNETGSEERKNRQLKSLGKKETRFLRLKRTKLTLEDFETVNVIGKGAFGEVRLVQKRDTGKLYAMKTLLKSEMLDKAQLAHVKAERDALASANSDWVVELYFSFQDAQYLYLIMEYLPGGDMMTMLIKWNTFTEDITRFYMAECVLAIEAVHKLLYIHRDIKPDNILIDKNGHIKLSDFGLSTGFHKTHESSYYKNLLERYTTQPQSNQTRNSVMVDPIHLTMTKRQKMQTWRKSRRLMAYSTVGTPDYIAPEIFIHQGYGHECDWWSLGAIMYECLIGYPPFCSETPHETYRKILSWKETLEFPGDIHLSHEAEDLIRRLLTSADNRLGTRGGAYEIKSHPFFRGVDWNALRRINAPFVSDFSSQTDTRNFPTQDLKGIPDSPALAKAAGMREQAMKEGNGTKEDLPFIGYTFSRFDYSTSKKV